ncbi:MAG TPA: DNA-3-methyladenine glycosylase I [Phycisphaerae bacterium]|nr:DNA-3-methyladenine glycosylase I [Phycisphaerae bacterium]
MPRCPWAKTDIYETYHDTEWGVPVHDERLLFEFLILEGAQAGLSWLTILRKRDAYRKAFHLFDPAKVARYTPNDIARLLANEGIVRNKLKIASAIQNAKAFLKVQNDFGSFDAYIWRFVDNTPIQNHWQSLKQIPPRTPLSDTISKDLRQRGFNFVGSTICYAHMQATGMVNDHLTTCPRHAELSK